MTFNLDYDFVNGVYQELLSSNKVFKVITGVKAIAGCLLLLSWYNKFFRPATDLESGKTVAPPPIRTEDVLRAIGIMLLVGSYDQILKALDIVLGSMENQFLALEPNTQSLSMADTQVKEEANKDWTASVSEMSSMVVEFLQDPFILVLRVLEYIFWIFDCIIYGIFLCERFYLLGILRVFGGFCLACMMVEKLEKWFWNWLGLYVAVYLLVIAYILVNQFTNAIYNNAASVLTAHGEANPNSLIMSVTLIFVVAVKAKLFVRANSIVFKIFS